jgi:CDP-paratose 2-epimerase
MNCEHVLITGGAGFIGGSLGVFLRQASPHTKVTALDNLKRRGSELNLARLRSAGIEFVHADIRCPEDLASLGDFDVLIDCSAEPSVHAGSSGSPRYVLETNLRGAWNCLELTRERQASFVFLSTSRVYPIEAINQLPYDEDETRFRWRFEASAPPPGASAGGISEGFSLLGARSFYGASKLSAEMLVQEYAHQYGLSAMINRCGLVAGPWQMGKVDQGVISLWVARHHFGSPLQYIGFGGRGRQVRDVLHVDDLGRLIQQQIDQRAQWRGAVYNVGGGAENSVSLYELTAICREITGNRIDIASCAATSPLDVRIYQSDCRAVCRDFAWKPRCSVHQTVADIHHWICEAEPSLRGVLC